MINVLKGQRKVLFIILSIFLVLVTWYILKIQGITLAEDTVYEEVLICENTEETHVHSQSCYKQVLVASSNIESPTQETKKPEDDGKKNKLLEETTKNKQEENVATEEATQNKQEENVATEETIKKNKQENTLQEQTPEKEQPSEENGQTIDEKEIKNTENNVINNNITNKENNQGISTYALDETSTNDQMVNIYLNIDNEWKSIGTLQSTRRGIFSTYYALQIQEITNLITNVLKIDINSNNFTGYYSEKTSDSLTKVTTSAWDSNNYNLGTSRNYKDLYLTYGITKNSITKAELTNSNMLKVYSITEYNAENVKVGDTKYVYTTSNTAKYTLPEGNNYYVNEEAEVTAGGTTIDIDKKTKIKQTPIEKVIITVKYANGTIEYKEVPKGSNYTLKSNLKWKIGDQAQLVDGGTVIKVVDDIVIEESKQITIKYNIDTSTAATGLSNSYRYDGVAIPTVQNSIVEITYNEGTVTENISSKFLKPYKSDVTSKDKIVLEFAGWKAGNAPELIRPGATLSWQELYNLAKNGVINLNTSWEQKQNYEYVNFYINYKSQALDTEGDITGQPTNAFTPSLWASYVGNAESDRTEIADNTSDNSYSANKQIRALEGDKNDGSRYIYEIPSDEYILSQLKQYAGALSIDGQSIKSDELNSEYFEVRWDVFKLQSDCWHIDGKLVRKEGKMVISKTFTGSKTAIESITGYSFENNNPTSHSNYYIEIKGGETTTNLYLQDATLENKTIEQNGVITYVLNYTWITNVKDGINYTISEKNYSIQNYIADVFYNINDPEQTKYKKIFNPDGTYYYETDEQGNFIETYINQSKESTASDTATVIGINNYAIDSEGEIDNSKLINLNYTNTYAPTSAITIKKEDSITNNGLKNAQFSLYEVINGSIDKNSPLKFAYDESIYTYNENGSITVLTSPTGGAIIIDGLPTNKKYKLVEISVPEGYDKNSSVEVELTPSLDENGNSIVVPVITKGTGNKYDETKKLLEVDNASKLTSVKLHKTWQDVPTEYIKGATVHLYLNNRPISSYKLDYDLNEDGTADEKDVIQEQVILNESNNWEHTWNNLPLYIDGSKAIYSVREVKIGDLNAQTEGNYNTEMGTWSSDDAYTQYKAKTTPQEETTQNGEVTQVSFELINTIHLIKIEINKISPLGQALTGATFKIQKIDANGQINSKFTAKEQSTDENGKLCFADLEYDTKYVITEILAPKGYYIDTTPIYVIINKGENGIDTLTIYKDSTFTKVAQQGDYEFVSLNEAQNALDIINVSHIEMPKAGGRGVFSYYVLGILLMGISSIIIYLRKNKIKKGK